MPAPAHWLPLVIVFASVALVALLWLSDSRLARRYRVLHTHLRCFTRDQVCECDFARDAQTGEFLGVRSCSAFPRGATVKCGKSCVEQMKRDRACADA